MNCLILFPLVFAAASSSDDAAMALNQKAQRMLERGRLPEAARTFAQASGMASNDLAAAMLLRNQAWTVLRMDDAKAAQQLADQALSLVERAAGLWDRHLTPVLNTLAEVALAEQRYADAVSFWDRAISIGESAGAHYARAIQNRAAVAERNGKFAEAKLAREID